MMMMMMSCCWCCDDVQCVAMRLRAVVLKYTADDCVLTTVTTQTSITQPNTPSV